MAPILGKPFLHYQVLYLKHFGIQNIVFSVGHLHEVIEKYFGNQYLGLNIQYAIEENPLGTGGGIRLALEKCQDENCLVLNGDSFFDCDLQQYFQSHLASKAECSLALRTVSNAARFGTIHCNAQKRIVAFQEKTMREEAGTINAGLYILNKELYFKHTPANFSFSIEKDFFEKKLSDIYFGGIEFEAYFIDIGLPEDFKQAQHDFERFKY